MVAGTVVTTTSRIIASDSFSRTVSRGLGAATVGGKWTLSGPAAKFSVRNGSGNINLNKPGTGSSAFLDNAASADTDSTIQVTLDKSASGGGTYISVVGRRVDTSNDYRLKLRYLSNGTVRAQLVRVVRGTETNLASINAVPGVGGRANQSVSVRFRVDGTRPTQLRAKVWATATTEPAAWQLRASDATPALQTLGGVGIITYLSGSATNAPITARIDNLKTITPLADGAVSQASVALDPIGSPSTTATSVAPPLTSTAVAPPPTSTAVAPPPTSTAVAPPPTSTAVAPPPTSTAVAPPPTSTAVAPPPTSTAPSTAVVERNASGFVHPGVFVGQSDIDNVKAHIAAGRQPWTNALNRILNSGSSTRTELRPTTQRYSSLSYVPAPVRVIQAASVGHQTYLDAHGLTNIGDVEHLDDARAAYTHALLWYLTDNRAHADKAIEIMNAWSRNLSDIKFDQPRRIDNGLPVFNNGKLQAGWGGALFARAGEIVRYSGAGWVDSDIARFETMLHDIYLPLVIDGWTEGANWLMTFAEATISIGVFTNDRAAFDAGIAYWRAKTPTTIYHHTDGAQPIPPASYLNTATKIANYWRNPSSYITGLQGETLRDLSHMAMGLGAMSNAAETAYVQGIDLFAEQAHRIIPGFELNAGYVNDYLDEVDRLGGNKPPGTWTPKNWPGAPGTFRIINPYYQSGWLVAHHHYTTRTGTLMPQTTRLVRRLGDAATQPALHLSWETLTHS
jgi:hypothetical protein